MWKKVFFVASLLVGIGIFIFVIQKIGFEKTFEAVAAIGWHGMGLYILVAAGTLVFPAIGWWILMRGEGMKVTLWTTLKANFMGFPINFIAPSMYLGAEPLKTFYLAHVHDEPKRKILATIIVSKYQEVGGILLVMIVALGISIWKIDFSRKQEVLLISAMVVLLTVFGVTLYAFVGNLKPTVKVINFLARFGTQFGKWKRKMARLRTRAEEMEHLIHAAFTKRWKTFVAAQAVTMLSSISILMRPWVYFALSRERMFIGAEYLCAIYVVTNLINVLPHTPGALGVLDGGLVGLFSLMEIGKEHGGAFAVANRVSDLVLLLIGTWLIVHYNMSAMAKRVAKGEEKVSVEDAEGVDGPTAPSA